MQAQIKAFGFKHGLLPPFIPGEVRHEVFECTLLSSDSMFRNPSMLPNDMSYVDLSDPEWFPHVAGRSALHPKPGTPVNHLDNLEPPRRYNNRECGEDVKYWRPGTFKTEVAGSFDFFGKTNQERFSPATTFNEYPWHPQHLDHCGDGKGCKLDVPSATNRHTHAAQRIDNFDLRETECHMAGSSSDAPRWVPQQVRSSSTSSPSINSAINAERNGVETRPSYRPDTWMA